jgi:type II secretory pathway predicted ATPase ExeA
MSTDSRTYLACQELENCVVLHPKFNEALEGLARLVNQTEFSGLPFGATVVGESGSGKSTLMKVLLKRIPTLDLLGEQAAAFGVSAQSCPTIGDLMIKLARQLGFPVALRGNRISDMSLNLFAALRERRARALFIQDFQHLYRGSRDKSAAVITDWLKQLVEETGVVLTMFGTPELGDLEHMCRQLQTRAPARYRLGPFARNDVWVEFLRGVAGRCKAVDWSPLHERFERELFMATNGLPRALIQLLSLAAVSAIDRKSQAVEAPDLSLAYRALYGKDTDGTDPFAGWRQ